MAYIPPKNLSGNGQQLFYGVADSSSAIISVQGTFVGEIVVEGSISATATFGPRLVMRAGVGPLGINIMRGHGDGVPHEYRLVTGGDRIRLTATNWVSGTATIEVLANNDPDIVFVNGPVHTAEDEAVRAGRAYLASTGVLAVSSGNALFGILSNPANSNRNFNITKRLFGNTSDTVLEYQVYSDPTATLSQVGAKPNRLVAGPVTNAIFTYQVAPVANITMGGTLGSGEPISSNGIIRERELLVQLPPGRKLGFKIDGNGNLIMASRLALTLEWYEEEI